MVMSTKEKYTTICIIYLHNYTRKLVCICTSIYRAISIYSLPKKCYQFDYTFLPNIFFIVNCWIMILSMIAMRRIADWSHIVIFDFILWQWWRLRCRRCKRSIATASFIYWYIIRNKWLYRNDYGARKCIKS